MLFLVEWESQENVRNIPGPRRVVILTPGRHGTGTSISDLLHGLLQVDPARIHLQMEK